MLHNISPFESILTAGVVASLVSVLEMNEALRFIILFVTALGAIIKLYEQYGKSVTFKTMVELKWKKIKNYLKIK